MLDAGAPLVMLVNQNMIAEAHQHGACVVFRAQPGGLDNPLGIDRAMLVDIPAIAAHWMSTMIPIWTKNRGADYYAVNNEWDIGTLASGKAISAFALECMSIADSADLKLCIFNFSKGCPSDDPVDGQRVTMEDRLETILPALTYATEHGHLIGLHAHGELIASGEFIALRHDRFLRFCKAHGFIPTVAITELSNGVGGVEPNMKEYLKAVTWWDQQIRASEFADHVIGGALYGFNAAESIGAAVPHLVKIMRAAPVPPDDPIVNFKGTCPAALYDRVAAQVMAAGGTIARM